MHDEAKSRDTGIQPRPNTMNACVGSNLRKARERKDISAEDLGRRLDIDLCTVEQYEAGTRKVTAVHLFKMASALETTLGVIFGMQP